MYKQSSNVQTQSEIEALLQKKKLNNELEMQSYLVNLSSTSETDYSLWKATYKLKRPTQQEPSLRTENGEWASRDQEQSET